MLKMLENTFLIQFPVPKLYTEKWRLLSIQQAKNMPKSKYCLELEQNYV